MKSASGVGRLAVFRADGLDAFDASPSGLITALTPWFAFALVGFLLMLATGSGQHAAGEFLASLVGLLTPPVVSHALARLWGRQDAWLRYAVAFTWCQWLMPVALVVALTGSFVLNAMGLKDDIAVVFAALAMMVYAVALHGFVARRALDLSWWRTVAMVAAINLCTVAAVAAPGLLRWAMEAGG